MPRKVGERPSNPESNEQPQQSGVVIALDSARTRREAARSGSRPANPCGHERHVGTCPACQRAQLARWSSQLASAGR